MSTVIAHDTTNRIHMLYHAMGAGRVVESLLYDLQAMMAFCKADKVFCCFDSPGPTLRHVLCDSYKQHRKPMDDELRTVIHQCVAMCDEKFVTLDRKGFEADDLLATVAKRAVSEGKRCVIATPDKDARQCIRKDWISVLRQHRRDRDRLVSTVFVTDAKLREEFGFGPDRWVDYQCLVGDTTDNITGWIGVGEKTAAKWLQVAPLDEIIAKPDLVEMTAKQQANGADFVSRLPVIRQLVTLREDVPI